MTGNDVETFTLYPIGRIETDLIDRKDAPRQADEDAPPARIVLHDDVAGGLLQLEAGTSIFVLTWLHLADRTTLKVHPRSEVDRPLCGVFATRSPDRPNPIGLHRTTVTGIEGNVVFVDHLEAVDGTPVLDIKPVLGPIGCR